MAAKMTKKTRNLIIGAAFLLVLVALLLVLLFGPGSQQAEDSSSEESSTVSTTTVDLIASEMDDICELQVENASGSYSILRTQAATDEEDAVYGIEELEGFDQSQDELSGIIASFANLSAGRLIEANAPDIAKYGLDDPVYTIRTFYDDGTEHTIIVGNTLTTGSGAYMMVDDDPNVYSMTNTKMERLDYSILDYLDKAVIETWESYTDDDGNEVTSPTIDYLLVEGGTLEEPFKIVPFSEEELASNTMTYGSTYKIVEPFEADMQYRSDADGNDQNAIYTTGLQQLTADSVAKINPTEEDLTALGFDSPYCVISFSRDGEEFVWTVGNDTTASYGSAAHYLMTEGKDLIYVVTDANLPWISIDINKMYSSLMLLPSINTVSAIDLTVYDETYSFEIDPAADEDSDLVPHLNGEEIDLENYRDMYQYLLSVPAEGIYKGDADAGTLIASIVYHYTEGGSDSVELFDLGDRTCILSINGNKQWTTRLAYVQHLESNIDKLQNGEAPVLDY